MCFSKAARRIRPERASHGRRTGCWFLAGSWPHVQDLQLDCQPTRDAKQCQWHRMSPFTPFPGQHSSLFALANVSWKTHDLNGSEARSNMCSPPARGLPLTWLGPRQRSVFNSRATTTVTMRAGRFGRPGFEALWQLSSQKNTKFCACHLDKIEHKKISLKLLLCYTVEWCWMRLLVVRPSGPGCWLGCIIRDRGHHVRIAFWQQQKSHSETLE